jgi:WD40 repeat protein
VQPTGPFDLLWTVTDAGGWNRQIAFTPNGEVLAVSAFTIQVLDAKTGRAVNKVPACPSPWGGGFGWLDATRAALVCDGVVREYQASSLLFKESAKRSGMTCAGAAVHPRLVVASDVEAVLSKAARVRLYDPRTWTQLNEIKIAVDEIEGVAIAPDGVHFALAYPSVIELREAPSGRVTATLQGSGGRVTALSYSQDGKLLFAHDMSPAASVIDVATQRRVRSYAIGGWVTQSQWLADGSIVATGSGGLWILYPNGTSALAATSERGFYGLAASSDGTLVCAGDVDGKIRMYRLRR